MQQLTPGALIHESAELLSLSNSLIELGFSRLHNGALASIIDKQSGHDLIRDKNAPKELFRLALCNPVNMELTWLGSDEASTFQYGVIEEGNWRTLALMTSFVDRGNLSVEIRVSLDGDSALSTWQMIVHNLGDFAVRQLVCPIVSGLVKLGDPAPGETFAAPIQGEGCLFKYPYPVIDRLPLCTGDGPESPHAGLGKLYQIYPGALSMQLYAWYNDFAGLYFAAHDAGQHPKEFGMGPFPTPEWKNTPVMSMAHYPAFTPGKDISFSYKTIVGIFQGDWHDAADIYKEWAQQQWWCEKKLCERDIPDWLRKGFGVYQTSNYHIPSLKMNNPLAQITDSVDGLSEELGVPLLSLIFNWEGGGGWSGPSGLFPPREGENPFRLAMARLRENGNLGFVYIPGGAWHLKLPYAEPFDSWSEFATSALPHAVLNEHQVLRIVRRFNGWEETRTCAYTPYTRELHLNMLQGCLERGVSVVQIDNFPCERPESCYDEEHGHPLGSGAWWVEAWGDILREMRRKGKAQNPNFALSSDGIAECFIPYLDIYGQRAPNMEYAGLFAPGMPMGGEIIPFFGYVYHEYIGSYSAAMPECNRPEVLYWTRCLGKALAQGIVPNGGAYFPEPAAMNPTTFGFFKKVVRAAAGECWPYLMFGEMLRRPDIDVPRITAPYCKVAADMSGIDSRRRHEVADAAVQHSAWRGRDGSIGYIFANISENPVDFIFDLSAYPTDILAASAEYRVESFTDGKKTVLYEKTQLPRQEFANMEPFSVMVIIVN